MSELIVVTGEACLDHINKPLGLASCWGIHSSNSIINGVYKNFESNIKKDNQYYGLRMTYLNSTFLHRLPHDVNNRIVGLVTDRYQDGGLRIVLLGDEAIDCGSDGDYYNLEVGISTQCRSKYEYKVLDQLNYKSSGYTFYPVYTTDSPEENSSRCMITANSEAVAFDDAIDFTPQMIKTIFPHNDPRFKYRGQYGTSTRFIITNDPSNTVSYGEDAVINTEIRLDSDHMNNPLQYIGGALYTYTYSKSMEFWGLCPASIDDATFYPYDVEYGTIVSSANGSCLAYNLILTENLQFALNYINSGVLPPDAFLYPLDWDNLPRYDDAVPTGDKPDDYTDDNNPDDDDRDFDPTPTETPTFTVNQLTNYNWYWLTVPDWSSFISWFWNDIGNYSGFNDLIAKVQGLYNDVASAVIMCRYYPVDVSWIGGTGEQSNIKLGMLEKNGLVDTISQSSALVAQDIGHVHIGAKYHSFMDMSPYSQLSLYLPFHGFIDLDINLFMGHDVYVKALYDYLSGTIQYYIYYDNLLMVNTILCKMAMDIPITLQTKNDRDSAIFNNVSSTIGGLVGAGVGVASGNPIGMTLGVTQGISAFNSAQSSAPMRLMGNVGESGAYLGFQNCFVVIRRPTIQPSDGNSATMKGLTTWKKNIGMLCGYGYTLSDLIGQGFTVCYTPRITFYNSTPLQTEIEEIYDYLQKGVIL